MEHLDRETLAQRLEQDALPLRPHGEAARRLKNSLGHEHRRLRVLLTVG